MRGFRNEAWVTGVTSELHVRDALLLSESLKRTLTTRLLVAIVSSLVSPKSRKLLRQTFDEVILLEDDEFNSPDLKILPTESALLYALGLQKFGKIVFLSPELFSMQNCDEIFQHPGQNFVCLPDMDISVSIFKPSLKVKNSLLEYLSEYFPGKGTFSQHLKTWFTNQCPDSQLEQLSSKYQHFLNDHKAPGEVHYKDMYFIQLNENAIQAAGNGVTNTVLKCWQSLYQETVHPLLQGTIPSALPTTHEKYRSEPIAIVGMSCRFPKSNSAKEFWDTLINGVDATGIPPDFRWLPEHTGNMIDCMNTNAGFLKCPVDEFDAKFFGISNKDAIYMDPQQRLLQELVWEGLEDAAIDPHSLYGVHGGVFVGSWVTDYRDMLTMSGLKEFYRVYIGNSIGAGAARISFLLGLTGPSIATESGCSSAMVAVHMATKSLSSGESNVALACGVNLLLHPFNENQIPMALAPDGRCKTFSAKADGFGRAEGCAVLVMKRLSDAVKNGDRIWGLIRGTAMTQEGISKAIGTPTVHCESLAMTQALEDANVAPEEVSYVEAHGTGTSVGDPLEVSAIAKAYHSKNRVEPLILGSVKTNIGHTEAVAGISGLMKVVLSLHHELIPPHLHLEKDSISPVIDMNTIPAEIPLEPLPWKRVNGKARIAGVSAFGIAGTDVHVIVEETPQEFMATTRNDQEIERPLHLVKISAKSPESLEKLLQKYEEHVKAAEESLADIAYTANSGRANFQHRSVVIAKTKEEFVEKIESKPMIGHTSAETLGKICFLFTGQGSQYYGMTKSLYETSPVFKFHFDRCEHILRTQYDLRIKPVLWGSEGKQIGRTTYSQTSIFVVEYALLKLWNSWGLHPDYVLGHSLSEFCAAVCAGILSLEDALELVAKRSLLIDQLPTGKMLVVKQNKPAATVLLNQFAKGDTSRLLDFAAVNSPEQTVVAGDSNLVIEFSHFLSENGVKCKVLDASHAFHSKHMDPMLNPYRQVAKSLKQCANDRNCEFISGVKGTLVEANSIDADYWVDHTRQAVNFLEASKKAVELGCQIFIEVGPQPVLSALTMTNCSTATNLQFCPSLKRNEEEWATLLHSAAKLYISGVDIDWKGFDRYYSRRKVSLPTYPFIRKKYWPVLSTLAANKIHPILGAPFGNASSSKIYDCTLDVSHNIMEYLKDHAIGDNFIFPGAGFLEMCLAAGVASTEGHVKPTRPVKVENLSIEAPLFLPESSGVQVQTVVDLLPDSQTVHQVKISHRVTASGENKWLSHAIAVFDPVPSLEENHIKQSVSLDTFFSAEEAEVDVSAIYDKLGSVGLNFGPIFRSVEKLWRHSDGDILVKVKCSLDSSEYIIHPVILDSMLQSIMMLLILRETTEKRAVRKKLFVPIKIGDFIWLSTPKKEEDSQDIYVQVHCTGQVTDCRATLLNASGIPLAIMTRVEVIDTTVKAVESVIQQQQCPLPDMWEESWKRKVGILEYRINLEACGENIETTEPEPEVAKNDASLKMVCQNLKNYTGLSMICALHDCGWEAKVGAEFYTDELFKQLQIQDEHRMYFGYMLDALEEEGILERLSEEKSTTKDPRAVNCLWRVRVVTWTPDGLRDYIRSPQYLKKLTENLKSAELLAVVDKNFANILQGKQSALPLLFPEDKKNAPSVAAFYAEYGNMFGVDELGGGYLEKRLRHLKSVMTEAGHRWILRILEIGAGTGAFTTKVLETLEQLEIEYEYTFTDISAGFFRAAETKFEKYRAHMHFKKLNLEEDVLAQGFIPEYFDFAVASEVVHATRDICESLTHVAQLLRPHGKFVLVETTQVNRYITFLVGLLPGYWRFQDVALRLKHCTMSVDKWKIALDKTGFEIERVTNLLMNQNSLIFVQKHADRRDLELYNLSCELILQITIAKNYLLRK